ncbi:hypothetical protein OH76DRAFT_431862 [Lentinus brumalis]|uniref:Uncharacterized protein n=1 Tax=Lentinus brumalis TaxID=2498619 RepID=A0A371DDJ1_9APHY|nr:hypothetical protein OH76DRAFT_431862 [Polyporus brumalis]
MSLGGSTPADDRDCVLSAAIRRLAHDGCCSVSRTRHTTPPSPTGSSTALTDAIVACTDAHWGGLSLSSMPIERGTRVPSTQAAKTLCEHPCDVRSRAPGPRPRSRITSRSWEPEATKDTCYQGSSKSSDAGTDSASSWISAPVPPPRAARAGVPSTPSRHRSE